MALDTSNGAVFGLLSIHTSDPARTRAFYSRVLDWQDFPDEEDDFFFMKRRDGSNPEAIVLGAAETGGVPAGQWIPQIAVDDIHAVTATCVEMGGQIISAIRQVSDEDPGLMCTIRDPDGAALGLIQVVKG